MIVKKNTDVEKQKIDMAGVTGVSIRWLIGDGSNAPNFYLRQFEVEPEGHSPLHDHAWEHEIFVLEGKGELYTGADSFSLEPGSFALVLPHEKHQFKNTGNTVFKFLCLIPKSGK
jgi:quercetin dioxygenase-like cupin family protein